MINYQPLAMSMKKKGISFAELKRITGRNDGALKNAFCNGVYIKTSTLEVICDSLNCDINDVIEYKPGDQKGLGKIKDPSVNWPLVEIKLKEKRYSLTSASIKILGKSPNYLTMRRSRKSSLPYAVLKEIASVCECNFDIFISD